MTTLDDAHQNVDGEWSTAEANRRRIIETAAQLLTEGGRDAVSIRAISARVGVQAPTIYRLFGDKRGLLDALAVHGLTTFYSSRPGVDPNMDPVQNLRHGWNLHITFGLTHPALYALIYGEPRPGTAPPAAVDAAEILAKVIHRIAEAGRLRVAEERATWMFFAAGCGTVLTLLALPEQDRDPGLADAAREAFIAAVITDAPDPDWNGPVSAAIALRAVLPQTDALTGTEKALLADWLHRITNA